MTHKISDISKNTGNANPDRIFTKRQAAEYLNISERTLDRLRQAKKIGYLQFTRGCVRFRESDCKAFLDSVNVKVGAPYEPKPVCLPPIPVTKRTKVTQLKLPPKLPPKRPTILVPHEEKNS